MNDKKRLVLVVRSGMCNRLLAVASALRFADTHDVCLFWTERTGRYGVPYVGPTASAFEDFFEPHPRLGQTWAVDSVQFATQPGRDLDARVALPKPGHGAVVRRTPTVVAFVRGAKVLDPRHQVLIVHDLTTPFGFTHERLTMAKYVTYPARPGVWTKDAYLRDLGRQLRTLTPVPQVRAAVARLNPAAMWGVHLRGTDLKKVNCSRVAMALAAVRDRAPPAVVFYVATDEPRLLREATATLGEGRVVTFEQPHKTENSIEGSRYGLVDLYALAACARLFGTPRSSFSFTAWLLSERDDMEYLAI